MMNKIPSSVAAPTPLSPSNDSPQPSATAGSSNEAIAQIRALLRTADDALARQAQAARPPKQREEDFDEAVRAHRHAVAILNTLQAQTVDDELVTAIAPLQVEAVDMEILISEIRFDETERTERLPRLRHI